MDLRSCYFCGTVGDALDTHALPRDDGGEPVRVTLCPDCRAKLGRVLEAVADRPVDGPDEGPVDDAPNGAGATDSGDATFRGTGEVTFDDAAAKGVGGDTEREGATDEASRSTAVETERTERADDEDAPDDAESREADPGDEEERDVSGRDGGDVAAAERDPTPGDGADAEPSEAADAEPSEAADAEPSEAADDDPDDGGDGSGEGGDESGSGLRGLDPDDRGRVATYRKALRLLQNREFPMERTAVVDLLESAYDLDRSECDRLLEFAVERELLVESGDELRRP
ncbi:MAG: hypothetical protein ABEJ61_07650 [Haloferacaceae archaeon]